MTGRLIHVLHEYTYVDYVIYMHHMMSFVNVNVNLF